jgi:hypothetical protein
VVREEVRLGLAFYRAEGEVERTAEAVAWELDRPAINGGGWRLSAGLFRGGEEVRRRCGSAAAPFMAQWRRRTGARWREGGTAAREAGGRAGEGRGGAAAGGRGRPDRWVPPVSERERERRGGGRWWAYVGRKLMG